MQVECIDRSAPTLLLATLSSQCDDRHFFRSARDAEWCVVLPSSGLLSNQAVSLRLSIRV